MFLFKKKDCEYIIRMLMKIKMNVLFTLFIVYKMSDVSSTASEATVS